MKLLFISAGVLIVFVGGYIVVSSPAQSESSSEVSSYQKFDDISADISAGAKLYDVRTPEEYAGGYIDNAELFPLTDIRSGNLPDTEKSNKIYVYCRSGNRSAEAKKLLGEYGFTDVIDLGGVDDVVKLGGKVVR